MQKCKQRQLKDKGGRLLPMSPLLLFLMTTRNNIFSVICRSFIFKEEKVKKYIIFYLKKLHKDWFWISNNKNWTNKIWLFSQHTSLKYRSRHSLKLLEPSMLRRSADTLHFPSGTLYFYHSLIFGFHFSHMWQILSSNKFRERKEAARRGTL